MQVSELFRFRNREIRALHLTWIAFFITFYVVVQHGAAGFLDAGFGRLADP